MVALYELIRVLSAGNRVSFYFQCLSFLSSLLLSFRAHAPVSTLVTFMELSLCLM